MKGGDLYSRDRDISVSNVVISGAVSAGFGYQLSILNARSAILHRVDREGSGKDGCSCVDGCFGFSGEVGGSVLGCVATGLIGLVCTCRQPTPPFPKRCTAKARAGSVGDEVPKPVLSSISTASLYEALRLAILTDEGASFD